MNLLSLSVQQARREQFATLRRQLSGWDYRAFENAV
jgi:hypothetical protein